MIINYHLTLDDSQKFLTLKSDEIHVWCASSDLLSVQTERLEQTLSDDELKRAYRFFFKKDRHRFIVGRGLLRTILSEKRTKSFTF